MASGYNCVTKLLTLILGDVSSAAVALSYKNTFRYDYTFYFAISRHAPRVTQQPHYIHVDLYNNSRRSVHLFKWLTNGALIDQLINIYSTFVL